MLVVAYLAALAPALLMAFAQPVWSLVDEAQHADFIIQLSHGVYPVADRTLINPETLQVSESTGVFRAFYPAGSYPTPDLTDVGPPPDGITAKADAAWVQRHLWQLSLESVQTPGYYVAMVPAWWLADRLGGPLAGIYTLRIINALLVATLAPMTVVVSRVLFATRPEVTFLAALFAILLPGFDLNGTRVSNDTLAAVVGGLIVVMAVRWAASKWSWRRTALAGLLLGAGLLVKLTLLGLAPALALSALWPDGATSWRGRITRVVVGGAIAVACLTPWFLLNLHNYGNALRDARVARLSDAVPGHLNGPFVVLDVAVFVLTYWTGEPWGALPLAALLAVLGALVAVAAPVGIIKVLRARGTNRSNAALSVAVAATVGMVGLALLLPASGSFEFVAAGRYAYPALPAAAALCALGVTTVLVARPSRQAVAVAYALLAVTLLAGGAAGLPPAPSAGARVPPATAVTSVVKATSNLNGVIITIDQVAFDHHAGATWLHATLVNSTSGEIEWTVPPEVSTDGASAKGEYRRSTQLPGDVDAGQSVSGWLFVPLDPASVRPGGVLHVRFVDVATADYRTVGDVNVDVKVGAS